MIYLAITIYGNILTAEILNDGPNDDCKRLTFQMPSKENKESKKLSLKKIASILSGKPESEIDAKIKIINGIELN